MPTMSPSGHKMNSPPLSIFGEEKKEPGKEGEPGPVPPAPPTGILDYLHREAESQR